MCYIAVVGRGVGEMPSSCKIVRRRVSSVNVSKKIFSNSSIIFCISPTSSVSSL